MKVYEYFSPGLWDGSLSETKEFICGTEYEIEDIKKVTFPNYDFNFGEDHPYWMGEIGAIKDNSLRNHGMEFVTRPCSFSRSLELFDYLHTSLKLGPNPYTHRTSIHVHVNVASLETEQLHQLLLLYALLEPVYFNFVGEKRKNNIHCVPLNNTLVPTYYSKELAYLVDKWNKYSALNLLPLRSIGTIEFRHMYGTGEKHLYEQWLTLIKNLWEFALEAPAHWLKKNLYKDMSVIEIGQAVLKNSFPSHMREEDFSSSLIDVKLGFV